MDKIVRLSCVCFITFFSLFFLFNTSLYSDGSDIAVIDGCHIDGVCTITFDSDGGSDVSPIVVENGTVAMEPCAPFKKGCVFKGWFLDECRIKSVDWTEPVLCNKLLYAHWVREDLINYYYNKTVVVYGDSISTLCGYTPENYCCYYTQQMMDLYNISFNSTYWGHFINDTGMIFLGNRAWSGSCVTIYNCGSAPMASYERINDITVGGVCPDVILIYAGINDCGLCSIGEFCKDAPYVKSLDTKTLYYETFAEAYTIMITRMKAQYPNSELIVLGPYYCSERNTGEIDKINSVIYKVCSYYGINYCNFSELVLNDSDLIDNLHPTNSGFYKMSCIVEESINKSETKECNNNTLLTTICIFLAAISVVIIFGRKHL